MGEWQSHHAVTSCTPPLCKGRWFGGFSRQTGGVVVETRFCVRNFSKGGRTRSCQPQIVLPPPRFARVKSKNRLKIGGFGLHKPDFHVFMRATRGGAKDRIGRKPGMRHSTPKHARPTLYLLPTYLFFNPLVLHGSF